MVTSQQIQKKYEAKDYSHLLGMQGFSDTLLNNHFKLYQGYVTNTNTLLDKLPTLLEDYQSGPPPATYAELKRRLGWEWNGMRLHEYYFGNLGGKEGLDKAHALYKKIQEDFTSFDYWLKDFNATGAMRGIGWVILYQDTANGRLINQWINEHDVAHLAGGKPLLVLDVFEHAYVTDYGIDRAAYIKAFHNNIDWNAVASRL